MSWENRSTQLGVRLWQATQSQSTRRRHTRTTAFWKPINSDDLKKQLSRGSNRRSMLIALLCDGRIHS